jgi:hypothetical protein
MEYFGWGIRAVEDVGESEAKKTSLSHLSVCPRDAIDEIYCCQSWSYRNGAGPT